MNFVPFKIKKEFEGLLTAEWDDGFKSVIKLEKLRNECPCADCREKADQSSKSNKFVMPTFSHGKNELKSLSPVGNYAINPTWGDGHDTGIYPWEFFRVIFENYKLAENEVQEFLDIQKSKPKIPDLKVRNN
ncbi:MAG: DUF971 domain-containing protein [Candidatus Kapabacteria bacterium]|jgi:DUF971 family protein|nr:DUF971 domain-containing protein [Candidatus Kapabacteria bacterium]